MDIMEEKLRKIIKWLEAQAKRDEDAAGIGRFDTVNEARLADAKNYRAMAADLKTALPKEVDSTMEALKRIASPFADEGQSLIAGEKMWAGYEDTIFNETRLYKALDKDEARSVLGIWRRFREMCELLSATKKK